MKTFLFIFVLFLNFSCSNIIYDDCMKVYDELDETTQEKVIDDLLEQFPNFELFKEPEPYERRAMIKYFEETLKCKINENSD